MIELKRVTKSFDKEIILKNFSLRVLPNKITVIFGPNGCGKSTLLRCIAGLEKVDRGIVNVKGKLSFVFQNPELSIFPWLNNFENVTIHLNYSKSEKIRVVREFINKLGFNIPLNKYPYQISGGQQQQLILLRALLNNPKIILLDEPFKGLDINTLTITKKALLKYFKKTTPTVILTTHNIGDAIMFADKLLVVGSRPMKVLASLNIFLEKKEVLSKEYYLARNKLIEVLKQNGIW